MPGWSPERRDVTLHTILVHMVAETNRHAGHADIVRETLDSQVGLRAGVSNLPEDGVRLAGVRRRVEQAARLASGRTVEP